MYEVPVIAVIGHKASGKTTVIENLIRGIQKEGYKIVSAKHVNQKDFSLDMEGTDTWRHSIAGANPVLSVSDTETAVIIKDGTKAFSLHHLFGFAPDAKVALLEGFSWIAKGDENVGKIICVRSEEEYESFKKEVKGEVIAFCSFTPPNKEVLDLRKEVSTIAELASAFIKKKWKLAEIMDRLKGLDCKQCGRPSCEELAKDIYAGKASLEDCVMLQARPELRTKITVNGKEILIKPFMSEIIYNTVTGMLSSLKGVSMKEGMRVNIEVSNQL